MILDVMGRGIVVSGAGTIFQQGGPAWCVAQSFPAGGVRRCNPPQRGPRQSPGETHFGNNILKMNLKSGLSVVAVYTPNSDPKSDVHWLVRRSSSIAIGLAAGPGTGVRDRDMGVAEGTGR